MGKLTRAPSRCAPAPSRGGGAQAGRAVLSLEGVAGAAAGADAGCRLFRRKGAGEGRRAADPRPRGGAQGRRRAARPREHAVAHLQRAPGEDGARKAAQVMFGGKGSAIEFSLRSMD